MKLLREIIKDVNILKTSGTLEVRVGGLQIDSRIVQPGDLFAAYKGTRFDGHDFIPEAVQNNASVILCERIPENLYGDQTWIKVSSVPEALGYIASSFYDHPSRDMELIGITGTNGKTSIATFLYHIFEESGYSSGLISTIRAMIHNKTIETTHTTPDTVKINMLLRQMANAGCSNVFMEVSSHALDQGRVTGLYFTGGVFTNLTHDHLDYHNTFRNYLLSKKKFFDNLTDEAFALINVDDRNGQIMVQNTKARILTYSLKQLADFRAKIIERSLEGTLVKIMDREVWIPFIGDFNIYNLLASYCIAVNLGLEKENVLMIMSKLKAVPGRFETLRSLKGHIAIVDYAHTPDALLSVLKAIRQIKGNSSKIITVVGAGGDRDKTKRPLMAKAGVENSNRLILTSDNPRSEDPDEIIGQMKKGIPPDLIRKVISITDRKEAIRSACIMADEKDIILVAGKGHETYQEVAGELLHFDDREVIREFFLQFETQS